MTGIDIIVLSVIGVSTLISLVRGFVRELLSLVGMVLASLLTIALFDPTQKYLLTKMSSATMASMAAGTGLFIGFSIVFGIANMLIVKLVRESGLSLLDRSLGVLFGLVRGALLVSLFFLVFSMMLPDEEQHPEMLKESKTLGGMKLGADVLKSMIPDSYWKDLEKMSADARKKVEEENKKAQELKPKIDKKSDGTTILELPFKAEKPIDTGEKSR